MDNDLRDMVLMCRNTPVLSVNFSISKFEVLNEKLLPFILKDRFTALPEYTDDDRYNKVLDELYLMKNREFVLSWLSNRTLSLSRKNAKWLYNLLKVEQVSTDTEKAKISIICRAVSVLDDYWIKLGGDTNTWEKVNVRKNHLNEIVAQIALHGSSLTLQGSLLSPEFTTNGAYAKAWRRKGDTLWLHKMGANGNTEARIEIEVSNLLDKCNVDHCYYEAAEDDGVFVCACPCMTTRTLSILPGIEFNTYCNVHGLDPGIEMLKIDAESIYKMWIVDYLIANRDRHGQNYGFYYDNETMEIVGCHPLFDHNNAFDVNWMQDPDVEYQFGDMSIKEAAHHAMKHVDFHFTDEITRDDFITDRHYQCFMSRAKELGIKIVHEPNKASVLRLCRASGIYTPVHINKIRSMLPSVEVDDYIIQSVIDQMKNGGM